MIKRIFSLTAILFSMLAGAQNIVIVEADSVIYGNASTTIDMTSYIKVKNTGNRSIDVLVKRIDKNYNALTDSNAICWGTCYSTSTSQTPFSSPMIPDSVYNEFSGHVYPDGDGVLLSGPITYVFFNKNNPVDSVRHTVYYTLTANFSVEEKAKQFIQVYPNPAKESLKFKSGISARQGDDIKFYDLTGRVVKTVKLQSSDQLVELNISAWPRGIYLYSFSRDGNTILTKKLTIQ